MYSVKTERKAFERLVSLGGVAPRSAFSDEEHDRLARIAKKTRHVRRMADGRWEVTARGWQAKNSHDDMWAMIREIGSEAVGEAMSVFRYA